MSSEQPPRQPAPDRARRRAIRAQAARAGVPYSVAARQLDPGAGLPASQGRTVYPAGSDTHRRALVEGRDRRPAAERVRDARRGADLPSGRAAHLVDRFPPTRGEPGTGVGPLYAGTGRCDTLALLYLVVAHEAPGLVPSAGDLAWAAEMGEETAVDMLCAQLDRAARRLLDDGRPAVLARVEAAQVAAAGHGDWRMRDAGTWLAGAYRAATHAGDGPDGLPLVGAPPLDGVGHILDAVLVVGDDGHAPGTRVRMRTAQGRLATIVGAVWGPAGPPLRYVVQPDGGRRVTTADPHELLVLGAGMPV